MKSLKTYINEALKFSQSEYVDKFGTEDELAEADIASTFCKEVYELLPLKDLYHNCKKAKKLQNQKNSDRYNWDIIKDEQYR